MRIILQWMRGSGQPHIVIPPGFLIYFFCLRCFTKVYKVLSSIWTSFSDRRLGWIVKGSERIVLGTFVRTAITQAHPKTLKESPVMKTSTASYKPLSDSVDFKILRIVYLAHGYWWWMSKAAVAVSRSTVFTGSDTKWEDGRNEFWTSGMTNLRKKWKMKGNAMF